MFPVIPVTLLPANEQAQAAHLIFLLCLLRQYSNRFESALTLFEATSIQGRLAAIRNESDIKVRAALADAFISDPSRHWPEVAFRDSIMTVYHFGIALRQIKSSLGKGCPSLSRHFDSRVTKQAWKLFDRTYFPNWESARHATAHEAEMSETPEAQLRNSVAVSAPDPAFGIGGTGSVRIMAAALYEGNKCTITWADSKGNPHVLVTECSRESLAKLIEIRDRIFGAVGGASDRLLNETLRKRES